MYKWRQPEQWWPRWAGYAFLAFFGSDVSFAFAFGFAFGSAGRETPGGGIFGCCGVSAAETPGGGISGCCGTFFPALLEPGTGTAEADGASSVPFGTRGAGFAGDGASSVPFATTGAGFAGAACVFGVDFGSAAEEDAGGVDGATGGPGTL